MKKAVSVIIGLSVLILLNSCSDSMEVRGHKAYEQSKRNVGNQKRLLEKTAYMMYQRAIKANPGNVNRKLRDRYIEISLNRAEMVLVDGTADMDAIPLIMKDVDAQWSADVPEESKKKYADFIFTFADSAVVRGKIVETQQLLDKAIQVAAGKADAEMRKRETIKSLVDQYYERAVLEYEMGKLNEDPNSMVKAEYMTKVVLYLDENHAEAQELLGKLYKDNLQTYSAYARFDELIQMDTLLFDIINKNRILLAIPTTTSRGGSFLAQVTMYNYSNNPQRLYAKSFYLEDVNGKKYVATSGSKIEPEILDQEHETKVTLVFPPPSGKIKRLVYQNEDYYSEKPFF